MDRVYKIIGLAMLLIVAAFLLAGCDSGGGANSEELRRLAGTNAPQAGVQQSAPAMPRPTETPDFSNAQPALQQATVIVEVTRETVREVLATVEVPGVQTQV